MPAKAWRLLERPTNGLAVPENLSTLATPCSEIEFHPRGAGPLVLGEGIHHPEPGWTREAFDGSKTHVLVSRAPARPFG